MPKIKVKSVDQLSRKPVSYAHAAFMRHCQLKNLAPYYEQRNTYLSGLWRIIYPRNRPIEIMAPGKLFDQGRAELFDVPDRLIVPAGEEIIPEK